MSKPTFQIESGRNVCIRASGFNWCQAPLEEIFWTSRGKTVKFQITPPCKYQKQQGWPEEPFVNVNLLGSKATTRANWLGYIGGWEDNKERTKIVGQMLEILEHGQVIVSGKVFKEDAASDDGKYKVLIYLSRKSLSEANEKAKTLPKIKPIPRREQESKINMQKALEVARGVGSFALIAACLFAVGWLIWMMFFKK